MKHVKQDCSDNGSGPDYELCSLIPVTVRTYLDSSSINDTWSDYESEGVKHEQIFKLSNIVKMYCVYFIYL